jgi:penicillin-binding protein 1C
LAPYGGNRRRHRAASSAYFGKEPKKLSLAKRRCWSRCRSRRSCAGPDRSSIVAPSGRDRVLDRIAKAGTVSGGRNRVRQAR